MSITEPLDLGVGHRKAGFEPQRAHLQSVFLNLLEFVSSFKEWDLIGLCRGLKMMHCIVHT